MERKRWQLRQPDEAQRAEALRQRYESRPSASERLFLRRLVECGGFGAESEARDAALGVLCALAQRLDYDQSRRLLTQLPAKLQQLMVRCKHHEALLPRDIHRALFLQIVSEHTDSQRDPLEATRAVLHALALHVSPDDIGEVVRELPGDLRELWPEWARVPEQAHETRQRQPAAVEPAGPEIGVARGFTELTRGAQMSVARAILPRFLAQLDADERQRLLRDLGLELALRTGPVHASRAEGDRAPESARA